MDIGHTVHYTAVPPGASVYSADGIEVGRVEAMLDNYREHIFDGVVFADAGHELRFVDAPEVDRTGEGGVLLRIDADQARALGPPDKSHPQVRASLRSGRLKRLLGGRKRR